MNIARWARRLSWAVLGLVLLMAAAWLGLPPLLKWQIEKQGSERLGRELRLGKVDVEPWALRLTLSDLRLGASAADTDRSPQLQFARLSVDADLRSIWRRAPVVEAVELDGLRLRLARLAPRHYDIDDILARLPPPQPRDDKAEPARFALFNLQLRDAQLHLDDRPLQRMHEVTELTLALPFLSNLPADVDVKVQPHLAFKLNGSPLELKGESVPFAADRATEMHLALADLDLARWWPYLPAAVPLRPVGGHLGADLVLRFAQPARATAQVGLSGTLGLRDIAVQDAGGAPLLAWKTLQVVLADVRPLERRVALKSVALDGAVLDLARAADGGINLTRLGGPAAAPASAPAPASAATGTAEAVGGWQLALDDLSLTGARVRWRDAALRPAVALDLADVTLHVQQVRWPGTAPAPLEVGLRLVDGNRELGRIEAKGTAGEHAAQVAVEVTGIDLAAAAPYLRPFLRPSLEGRLGASATLDWAAGDAPALALALASVKLENLRITEPGSARQREVPVQVAAVELADSKVDLLAHRVQLGTLRVRQPALQLRRDAQGEWTGSHWAVVSQGPAVRASTAVAAKGQAGGWQVELRDLRIEGGSLRFDDALPRPGPEVPPVAFRLKALRASAQGIAWPFSAKAAPVRSALSAQIVPPPGEAGSPQQPVGKIDWRGQVWPQPGGARGTLAIERFPVQLFEPYFGDRLPVVLRSAELGYKGDLDAMLGPQGLKLASAGDLLLADLRVGARSGDDGAADDLLAWHSFTLKPLKVSLAPGGKPQIEIGEAQLTDFFARLEVTPQGRLNLQEVGAKPAGAASAPAAAASAPAAQAARGELPVDITVGSTKFVNGRVDFSDRFIKPNYSADLSELNGGIGRISSTTPNDLASIEIRGRAARTALLEIGGALNPVAARPALDISAKVTDLELAPLSAYSGKYAGYGIERGKLSLDVAYKIEPDGKLSARNKLVLNQLTFGDKVDSPQATKLPVRLAVALLTDSNGVIDINMPISGSINDPQFSIWGLVWQVVGNLLTKAVTAPFALLSGSESADLSVVPFEPGSVALAGDAAATLDKVAQALAKRPALHMTVTGAADTVSEREGLQRANVEARLQAERRRELLRGGATLEAPAQAPQAGQATAEPALPPLSAEERDKLVRQLYRATNLPDKPRNAVGLVKDIPVPEMEARLMAAVPVTEDSARQLALQRGLAVRDALIERGLPSERLFLAAPKLHVAGEGDAGWTPRAQLTLATK